MTDEWARRAGRWQGAVQLICLGCGISGQVQDPGRAMERHGLDRAAKPELMAAPVNDQLFG
jgi:hypothetical protein